MDKKEANMHAELVRVRKLLTLQLVAYGVKPSTIGKALGVTAAAEVRKLVPVASLPSRKGR